MARKRWSDLSDREKTAVLVMASVQISLAVTAWVDLARRPAELVRGPKPAWAAVIAVNFVGPVSYFAFGRRRAISPESLPAALPAA
jgi:Phospholipase_D-nuclease N-terminal